MNITINHGYAELVPEVSTEEYEALKKSVKENGLYVPIIVNQNGVLLDGHHRYKACQELGIEPAYMVREFNDELDEKLFVIDCNLTRRQLNNFQRTEVALKSKPILEAIAKRNESLGGKGDRYLTSLGRVNERIGEKAGVSHDTVRKVENIIESFSEGKDKEVLDKLRAGKLSINEAYQRIPIHKTSSIGKNGSIDSCPMNSRVKQVERAKSGTEEEPLTQGEQQTMTTTTRTTLPQPQVSPEHAEYVINEEVRYDSLRDLIQNLSGLSDDQQREFDNNAREMANQTKDFRFKTIKRMSDTDVRMSYGYSQELHYLLDDFMKQLDNELDVREKKKKLVSE